MSKLRSIAELRAYYGTQHCFSFKFNLSIVKQVSGLVQSDLADLHPSQILHVGDDMDKAQSYVVFFPVLLVRDQALFLPLDPDPTHRFMRA